MFESEFTNPIYGTTAFANQTDGTYLGKVIHCPCPEVNCVFCDQCGVCHAENPLENCESFAACFSCYNDYLLCVENMPVRVDTSGDFAVINPDGTENRTGNKVRELIKEFAQEELPQEIYKTFKSELKVAMQTAAYKVFRKWFPDYTIEGTFEYEDETFKKRE